VDLTPALPALIVLAAYALLTWGACAALAAGLRRSRRLAGADGSEGDTGAEAPGWLAVVAVAAGWLVFGAQESGLLAEPVRIALLAVLLLLALRWLRGAAAYGAIAAAVLLGLGALPPGDMVFQAALPPAADTALAALLWFAYAAALHRRADAVATGGGAAAAGAVLAYGWLAEAVSGPFLLIPASLAGTGLGLAAAARGGAGGRGTAAGLGLLTGWLLLDGAGRGLWQPALIAAAVAAILLLPSGRKA